MLGIGVYVIVYGGSGVIVISGVSVNVFIRNGYVKLSCVVRS